MGYDAIHFAAFEVTLLGGLNVDWHAKGVGVELRTKVAVGSKQGIRARGLSGKSGKAHAE
ncbi:MAG: hypothetical protein A3J70_10020 [Elusimicrobia bacterium RIFCSPHIGHO2_02_FULL_61_10]|nr:MAG: hypothetical protein A3J70_10020 [Elusimicrobia bacterium RIFCSPHIGHO2_02_FULL_61_10]